jgi:hypothetical protein
MGRAIQAIYRPANRIIANPIRFPVAAHQSDSDSQVLLFQSPVSWRSARCPAIVAGVGFRCPGAKPPAEARQKEGWPWLMTVRIPFPQTR